MPAQNSMDTIEVLKRNRSNSEDDITQRQTAKAFKSSNPVRMNETSSTQVSPIDYANKSNEKDDHNSTFLKITFIEQEINFMNVSWGDVEVIFNEISSTWDFIAFANQHKSVIFTEHVQSCLAAFIEKKQITIENVTHNIKIEKEHGACKKGVIYNLGTIPMTAKFLMDKLKPQGVREIFKLEKIGETNNEKYLTGSVLLVLEPNFNQSFVSIGTIKKVQVNILNPRPMLCYHCGYLGHTSKKCKNIDKSFCKSCFEIHSEQENCSKKCKNCPGEHSSIDKRCPGIKQEIEILKVKLQYDITYFEAKNIVKENLDQSPNKRLSHSQTFQELLDENTKMFDELRIAREDRLKLIQENNNNMKVIGELKIDNEKLEKDLYEARNVVLKQEAIIETQEDSLRKINSVNQGEIKKLNDEVTLVVKQSEVNRKENVKLKSNYAALLEKYNKLEKEKAGFEGKIETSAKATQRSKSRSNNTTTD